LAGIDESGRGPLAGPVVAAAVVLPPSHGIEGIADSKKLTPAKRDEIYERLVTNSGVRIGIGIVGADTVDRMNIRNATLFAMRKALDDLGDPPGHVLVDGPDIGSFQVAHTPVVGGDALCEPISAASIIAKVTRDEIMFQYGRLYPEYDFQKHKGYGTRAHIARLREFGPCRIHRRTFEPLKGMLGEQEVC
jgi:ribonuclease HII